MSPLHLYFIIIIIVIIIVYFENVAFFYAKLGSDVCPRVDNQKTSGDTLQDLTRPLVGKSPSGYYSPMGIGQVFGGRMPFHTNQFGLGKRHWNLETFSAAVEFPPPSILPEYDKIWMTSDYE